MKIYPKILGGTRGVENSPCIAFEKYDGSNLRFEYSKNSGWYKFGTRRRRFDETDPEYGPAIPLFMHKYAAQIERIILDHPVYSKSTSFVAYAEYVGPHSFAGKHDPDFLGVEENPLDLILFDINIHKRGFISPEEFVGLFQHLPVAEVVYQGRLNEGFVSDVRQGKYPVNEGVIVKGGEGHNLWMRKIKTFEYLDRLKDVFGQKWKDHWE